MTNRRIKLLNKLIGSATGEDEAKLYKLTIERICIDMCDYYQKFYQNEGPGAMVYAPKSEENSMFYLTVEHLMNAVEDLSSRDMPEYADVMRRAIIKAEEIDPKKEALFILQDPNYVSLIHYDKETKIAVNSV